MTTKLARACTNVARVVDSYDENGSRFTNTVVTIADLRLVLDAARRAEEPQSNTHLPPRSIERLEWLAARKHCGQCLKTPIEPDRWRWAQPTCHDCMPPLGPETRRPTKRARRGR